jgi:hypothetical protein
MTIDTQATKVRTITLTTAAPVRIREADWPFIAQASETEGKGGNAEVTWMKVRRHADGRAIVYGGRDCEDRPLGMRGGELVKSGGDIAAAIWRLSRELDASDLLTRELIAKLPAVEI